MTTNPADLVKPPVVVPRDDSHDKFVTTLKQAGYGVIHTALTRTVTLPDAERLTAPDLWQGGRGGGAPPNTPPPPPPPPP
ncbi:hypothetical protein HMPREF9593_02362, partial [Cutibacterium acnes HL046PA2]